MGIETSIISTGHPKSGARVSSRGQLIVAPLDFSKAYNATAAVAATPANFVGPSPGKQFVITSIHLYANKNVGNLDAAVEIFEADSPTSSVVLSSIFEVEMPKYSKRDLTGLNLIATKGVWINIITDDDDVFGTIMGYYVAAHS